MSEQHTINAEALREHLDFIVLENLTNQTMVSAMRRLAEMAGELEEDGLAGVALELEALLTVLGGRLTLLAGQLAFDTVERRCAALADLAEIRQAEGGDDEA